MTARRRLSERWAGAAMIVWPTIAVGLVVVPISSARWWAVGLTVPVVTIGPLVVVQVLEWRAVRRIERLQVHPRGAPPGVCRICGMDDPEWVDWGAHPSCREWLEAAG